MIIKCVSVLIMLIKKFNKSHHYWDASIGTDLMIVGCRIGFLTIAGAFEMAVLSLK